MRSSPSLIQSKSRRKQRKRAFFVGLGMAAGCGLLVANPPYVAEGDEIDDQVVEATEAETTDSTTPARNRSPISSPAIPSTAGCEPSPASICREGPSPPATRALAASS